MKISYSFGIMDLSHYGHLKALEQAAGKKIKEVAQSQSLVFGATFIVRGNWYVG